MTSGGMFSTPTFTMISSRPQTVLSTPCPMELITPTVLNTYYTQVYRIKGGGGSRHTPSPPIISEQQILPQQTIHCWKGNLTASRIHFKYWKSILILRLYEQSSRNDSAIAPEWQSEKISKKVYEHIIHHFKACDPEIPLI